MGGKWRYAETDAQSNKSRRTATTVSARSLSWTERWWLFLIAAAYNPERSRQGTVEKNLSKQYITVDNSNTLLYTVYTKEDDYEYHRKSFIYDSDL